MKEIEVPDVGVFEFPDNITDEQAELEIQQYLKSQGISDPHGSKQPGLASSFMSGLVGSQQALVADAAAAGIIDPETGSGELARLEREKRKYPTPKALEEFFASGNDAGTLARNFVKAPLTITANLVAQSLGTSAPAAVTGLVGSVGGPVGMAVGVGTGSFALEAGSKFLESLQEAGVDLKDENSIVAAFGNEKLMATAREKAVLKGLPIAVVDGLTAGIAGRFVSAAKTTGKKIAAGGGELAIQAAGGAGGEAAGQYAADGEFKLPEIAAEAIGEVGFGAGEIALGTALRSKPAPDVDLTPDETRPDTSQKLLTYEKKGQLLLEDLRPDIELLAPPEDPQLELPKPPREYSPESQSQEQIIRGAGGKFTKTSTGFVMGEQLPLSEEAATFKREQEVKTRQLRQQQLREQATLELGEKGLDIVSGRLEAIDVNEIPGNLVQRLRVRDIKLGISDQPRSVYFREDLQGIGLYDQDVDAILGTTPEVTPNEVPMTPNVTRGQFMMALRNILSNPKTSIESIKKAADFRGPKADQQARELLSEMARTGLIKADKNNKRFTIGKAERAAIELAVAAEFPNGGVEAGTMQREGFTGTAEQISKQNGLFKRDGTPFKSANEFDTELEALRAERQQLQDQVTDAPLTKEQRAAGADRLRYFNRYIQKLEAAATSPAMERLRGQELDQPRIFADRAAEWVDTTTQDLIVNEVRYLDGDSSSGYGVASVISNKGQKKGEIIYIAITADGYRSTEEIREIDVPTGAKSLGMLGQDFLRLVNLAQQMADERYANFSKQRRASPELFPNTPFESTAPKVGSVTYAGVSPELAKILNGWVNLLGMKARMFLVSKKAIATDADRTKYGMYSEGSRRILAVLNEDSTVGMATGSVPNAISRALGGGNTAEFTIMLDVDQLSEAQQVEYLAHELGHAIQQNSFESAPTEVQDEIRREYSEWVKLNRVPEKSGLDLVTALRGPVALGNLTEGSKIDGLKRAKATEMQTYWSSFNEWFADNVAKWATSRAEPMSVVDKFFAGVAKQIRRLWEMFRQHGEKRPITVAPTVAAFLDEMIAQRKTLTDVSYERGPIHESSTSADNRFRRAEARASTPYEGSIDRSAAAQRTSDRRSFGDKMSEHTTRMNAARSLDDVLTDAEPAQNWLKGNFTGDINSQRASDMGWASFWMRHPMQVATKSKIFEPVWRFIYARFRQQSRIIAEAEDGALTYRKLSTVERANVNKALDLGDQTGIEFNIANGLRPDGSLRVNADLTLSPKEVEGYIAVRKSINFMWKEMIKAFNAGLGLAPDTKPESLRALAKSLAEAGKREKAANMNKAADTLSNMLGAYRKGYMPHMRFGDHGVKVTDADGNVVWYEARDIPAKRGREKALREWRAELQAKFPASKGFTATPPFYLTQDSIRREVGDVGTDLERLISAFGNKDMEFWKEAHAKIDDMLRLQGFLSHQRHRKNVPGYSQDWGRVLDTYFKRGANFVAYQTQRQNVNDALKKIPESMPRLRKYAEDYVQYAMGPVEEFQTIRNATFNWFFGFNLSLGLINMTQVPFATVPYFTRFAGDARIAKEVARAYKDAAKMFSGKRFSPNRALIDPSRAPTDLRDDLIRDWNEAVLFPLQTADFTGMGTPGFQTTTGRGAKYVERVTKIGAMVFQMAEETNRLVTYIAAHRLARDPKIAKRIQEAMAANPRWTQNPQSKLSRKFASFSVEETQFLMGKINRPKIMRGPGAVAFQFMSFPLQMLELIGRLATTYKAGKPVTSKVLNKQLAIMALFMFATAGTWGLPFAENLKDLFQTIYKMFTKKGIDLDVELRELIQEMGGDPVTSDAFSRGIVRSLTGIDLSKRLGLGSIIPDGLFKGDVTDAIGAGPATLINGVQRAMQRHASGQPLSMVLSEVSPVALKNAIQAVMSHKVGVQTATGRQVMRPEDISTGMGMRKSVGFTPTETAREFEKDFSQQAVSVKVRDLQSYYLNKLAANRVEQVRARRLGEEDRIPDIKKERNAILREIKSHNKAARDNNEYESLVTIKVEDVRAKVKETLNPDRRLQRFAKKSRKAAKDIEDLYPE